MPALAHLAGLGMEFGEGELGGAVDGNEEVELAFGRLHLGDVEMEVADRIALELLLARLVAVNLGQAGDAVTLKAAMQAGARQPRDRGLQGVKAVVEGQRRMFAERDDDGFILGRQHRRPGIRRTCLAVSRRGPLFPLRNRLWVDSIAPGERPQALFTMLYRSTDCRRRCGAAMVNLAHSASFHSREKTAPSKPGTKHIEWMSQACGRGYLP